MSGYPVFGFHKEQIVYSSGSNHVVHFAHPGSLLKLLW